MSSASFSGDFAVLDFYTDNEDSSALTVMINNVRFHIIAQGARVRKGKPGQEYANLLQAVKEANIDDVAEDSATADSAAAHSGIDLAKEEKAPAEATESAQERTSPPEEALHRWMLAPLSENMEELAPSSEAQEVSTLQDWFIGESHFFDLAINDGKITATELEATDELLKRVSDLLPEMNIPKYIHELSTPYFHASDLDVLSASTTTGPYSRPCLVRTPEGAECFLKLIDPTQPGPTKREISLLAKFASKGLHNQIRCPRLAGLVGTSADTRTKIVGFLQTPIPSPTPLTAKLSTDVSQALRDSWADEAERIITILHANSIVWGDAKADNFIVDKDENLWIIDFGGSYTEGWVNPAVKETEKGDDMGVEKIENALVDPVNNTWDPDTEVSYGGNSNRRSEGDEDCGGDKRLYDEMESDAETDVDEDASEGSTSNKRQRVESPPTSPLGADEPAQTEKQPVYCYCQQPNSGRMIGCDRDDCEHEWFHFKCVGLEQAPGGGEDWYCRDCA